MAKSINGESGAYQRHHRGNISNDGISGSVKAQAAAAAAIRKGIESAIINGAAAWRGEESVAKHQRISGIKLIDG